MFITGEAAKSIIRKYGYWIFAVAGAVVLVVLEGFAMEPASSILAFLYWSLLIFWAVRWLFGQVSDLLKQKKEKAETELLHLQSQVSPHFFFNTLNNLYGLIGSDAKRAQQLVLKLSDLMRYSIYTGQKEAVTLEEEVEYLNNYIELHTNRYHKKIEIQFNKHIQKEGMNVKPLLLIVLIENAFKHGVESLCENAYVHIHLIANENEISFTVENNFERKEPKEFQGIGLKNLHRRLELMYPKKHSLTHSIIDTIYNTQLTLSLK